MDTQEGFLEEPLRRRQKKVSVSEANILLEVTHFRGHVEIQPSGLGVGTHTGAVSGSQGCCNKKVANLGGSNQVCHCLEVSASHVQTSASLQA